MKIGSLCYATSRGLGHLARAFYQHGVITDVCIVRHPGVPTNEDWYPDAPYTDLRHLNQALIRDFAASCDVMLFFETPFEWDLIPFCREKGIKTVIIPMYECTPCPVPHWPDLWLCPSLLDLQYFPKDSVFIPLPVEMPWKLRERAEHFIHNGGYLGLRGREGTTLLIEAMQHVRSPIRLTIRVQENVSPEYQVMAAKDPRIDYRPQSIPFDELYATGDVSIHPQRFNGCSLPLQEAYASGLLMMTTNRFPMNTWLPNAPLIPVARYARARVGGRYMEFDEAQIRPVDIAAKIDEWYGKDIASFSNQGREWAATMSWEVLKPRFMEAISK